MRSCLIFNPSARGDKARSLRRHLDTLSAHCELRPTSAPGEAQSLAANAVLSGFETVIAGGGDGTVNEVLNGIADVPGAFERVRLGIMPLGTVNVFARELGIRPGFDHAWEVLGRGNEIRIDLPLAEFVVQGRTRRRYFIQLAGAGLDSRAIELVNWELKKKIGPLAYVVAGLKAIRGTHPKIDVEGIPQNGELVLLGNGRFYGGSYSFFPKASLQDGMLDICVFPKVRWDQLLRVGLGLATGHPHRFGPAHQLQAPAITLTSKSRVLLELDGENVGELPAKISLVPKALRVVVP